jgi:hypothetical protein
VARLAAETPSKMIVSRSHPAAVEAAWIEIDGPGRAA